MIDDARLDQLVHAALEREAGLAAARQPKLDQAVAKLVRRIGPSGVTTRVLVPVRVPALNLLVVLVLLLLALLAAAYVGSRLVSLPPVPPFGFAFPCDRGPVPGLALGGPRNAMVLSLVRDSEEGDTENVQAYADGTYVRDLSVPGETRASTVTGALVERRRLTAEGLALLVGRVESVGLANGCRRLSATTGAGTLDLTTADGTAGVSWGTADNPRARPVSEEEEAALVQLQLELTQPDSWLPESAWVDPAAEEVRPHHWLLVVRLHDTGYEPDAEVTLPSGDTIIGVDPRYELLAMPGDVGPAEFGTELALADPTAGTTFRCGPATTAEAEALNASLDALDEIGAGTDDDGLVYGPDVSTSVADVSVQPIYGPDYDCAALADDRAFFSRPHPTATPAPVTGGLASVDPCSLMTGDALTLVGATDAAPWPHALALGRSANACVAFTGTADPLEVWDPGISYPADWRALLALYPDRLTAGAAARVVQSVLGAAVIEEVVAGGTMWPARCPAEAVACLDVYAAWGAEKLVFIEFTGARELPPAGATPGFDPDAMVRLVTPEAAQAFVEAVVAAATTPD